MSVDLVDRDVLLVGAGKVALRKAQDLLDCGARLRVVAPWFEPGFAKLVGGWTKIERPWTPGDEQGARLVVAATSDPEANRQIYEACAALGILCNVVDVPDLCDFYVPAVARGQGVQISIGTDAAAPSLSAFARRKLLEWIGDGFGDLVQLVARLRAETRARLTLPERERFWKTLDWEDWLARIRRDGPQACEAALRAEIDRQVSATQEPAYEPAARGRVVLVGAGPGHPDLITRMGLRALGRATALVYDRLVSPELLRMVPTSCQLFPVGKKGFEPSFPQSEINALLVQLAREGQFVVRLKGGDPFVFGRGGEEVEACLAAGVAVEVVPGLSSSLAVPAYAGIPITHRGLSRSFAIISGFHADGRAADVPDAETIIVMMPLHSMAGVRDRFLAAGWAADTPCAAVQAGTTAGERVLYSVLATLDQDLQREGLQSPLIVVVGRVAGWAREHAYRPELHTPPHGAAFPNA